MLLALCVLSCRLSVSVYVHFVWHSCLQGAITILIIHFDPREIPRFTAISVYLEIFINNCALSDSFFILQNSTSTHPFYFIHFVYIIFSHSVVARNALKNLFQKSTILIFGGDGKIISESESERKVVFHQNVSYVSLMLPANFQLCQQIKQKKVAFEFDI